MACRLPIVPVEKPPNLHSLIEVIFSHHVADNLGTGLLVLIRQLQSQSVATFFSQSSSVKHSVTVVGRASTAQMTPAVRTRNSSALASGTCALWGSHELERTCHSQILSLLHE